MHDEAHRARLQVSAVQDAADTETDRRPAGRRYAGRTSSNLKVPSENAAASLDPFLENAIRTGVDFPTNRGRSADPDCSMCAAVAKAYISPFSRAKPNCSPDDENASLMTGAATLS